MPVMGELQAPFAHIWHALEHNIVIGGHFAQVFGFSCGPAVPGGGEAAYIRQNTGDSHAIFGSRSRPGA
jgi:hypothetical protein